MVEHKCNTCFYGSFDKRAHPCNVCEGYNKYVNVNVYKSDTQEVKTWDSFNYFETPLSVDYSVIEKPKHYMLFEDKGIEVRDVIEKLVIKIQDQIKNDDYPQGYAEPMFIADYVQMMQYLMRFMEKNGKEDLGKARWYLDKLIEAYE